MARPDPDGARAAPRVALSVHLGTVWGLRATLAANRLRHGCAAPTVAGALALATCSLGLGFGAFGLLSHPAVGASELWSNFLLRFFAFVLTAVFVAWPVLSAGIDEHSELSRFATFPITPLRLFLASTVSSFFEARSLFFWPPLAGAVLGYHVHRPFSAAPGVALSAAYLAFNLAWGRAALTLVLNVLRHRRSAEILGALFLGGLFLASLVPPLPFDVAWLYEVLRGQAGSLGVADDRFVHAANLALGRLVTGAFPVGLQELSDGSPVAALSRFAELLLGAAVGMAVAYGLLLRFYRGTARPPATHRPRSARPGRVGDGALRALLEREASDFLRNPKARLLASVPFFLCILMRLAGARDLGEALAGRAADAWLLSVLCSYAGLVVGANFAQNVFAYDGPGLALLWAAPVPLRSVFLAKNLVHAAGALAAALLLAAFYSVYIHPVCVASALFALVALLGQVPVLLTTGNLVSVLAPRKFHASLRRRDRSTALATISGIGSAALAVTPVGAALSLLDRRPPGPGAVLALTLFAALAWALYLALLPLACRLLEGRRETVLRWITRE